MAALGVPGGTVEIDKDFAVPRMGYGAMRLTGEGVWGDFLHREVAVRVLQRAYELGVRLFDTADAYGPFTNEALVAEAFKGYDDVVIATKGGLTRSGPGVWEQNGKPEHLRRACEGSLQRLGREVIDLYQLHSPDSRVPYEESIGALADLQAEGKIRHVGVSNVDSDQLRTAQAIVRVASVQNRYNLIDRSSEEVLQACEMHGIVFLPWFPIAAGELSRAGGPIDTVAKRHDATNAQISLAWLLQHSRTIAPIPGTSSVEHLEENMASTGIWLTNDDLAELEDH